MIKNNLISITLKLLFHTRSFSFIAFLIFLSICFPRAYATESGIFNFSNINLKNGLSQLSVLAIAQDSKGYIWFATRNGLNKYDGEKFTIYKHDNDDPHSLSDNHITCLLPDDANEGLWVGTNNGLNYINLKTNQITKYQTDDYPNMPGNNIAVLQFDQSGNLWVGTRTGLCIWQPRSGKFKKKYSDHVPENEAIMQLYIDAEKRLYIGTHRHGLFICTPEMELIQQLNKSTQPALSDDAISCIFEDSQHQVWIGTETRGLNKWNPKTKDLSIYNQKNSGLTNDYIRCITEQDQKLIIGTFDGLSILDLRNDDISKYNRFDANQNSLSHFSVRSIYIDREKTLWVGTYSGGVNYYNPLNNRFIFYHPVENNNQKLYNIFGTMVYDSTSLWIATEGGGLMQFNPITKEYTNFLIEQTSKGLFNKNIIKSLLLDGDYIWCGTSTGGVYKFHIPSKKFTLVYSFGREKNFAIYTFYKDAENNLWIGTTADKGLVKLSPDGKITNQFPYGKEKKEFVNFTSLRSFLALNAHTFLIGTRSFGLYEYDMQKGTVLRCNMSETNPNQKLENNYITSMVRKANGEIWFSTFGGGIYLYKQGTGVVKHIGKKEGLPNNEVYAMVEHNNNLWISVDKEIAELNTKTGQIRSYDCFVGSETLEFTPQGVISLPHGEVYFSGSNGFLSFTPGSLLKNNTMPPVVLTQLTVNNKVITPNDDTHLLDSAPDDTQTLVLAYNQNNFSIAYSALNYILHEQNQYAYKLSGHDEDWNYVGSRKEAFYTNIAPGKYTFQVIASNNDGVWNETGKKMEIIIRSPWWGTPLAYILYVLSALGIMFTIGYYMYSKHKLELDLRMKQMEKQRMEEFHQTKLHLFTNFSHELRTPLTLIISPLEELMKRAEVPQFIRTQLDMILKNARRLLLLVNQLMDLQKNQSGNLTLQLSQSDLNAFLLEIFYTFRQIAESKQIRFEYQAPQGEVTACFDQGLLEKAVFNLLSNAFKFTVPGDTITLRLLLITDIDTLRQEHSDWLSEHSPLITTHQGSYLVIQVADTGKGIPEDERTQIFTPFYQVGHTTGSENMNGTGIGLSLTQSVVHLHHGEIGVTANTPKGSVFTILLPNHTMTEEEVANTAVLSGKNNEQVEKGMSGTIDSENTISGTTPSLPGKTVLLVEDNEEIRSYVKGHLEQYYNVLEADNGSDAFEIVLKEFPDLVVTDIMMPGIDGLELCALIKNNLQTGHIPVILLTARTMVMHVKEGFLSGADDYVVKPFNIDVLLVRIYNLLAQREKLKSVYSKNFSLQSMGIEVETTSADEKFMQKLFKIIEKYLTDPDLKVDKICEEMGFSRSNLYRKLKAITDLPLNDLIRHKRLEIATQMLKQTEMNITEIATATGFSTLAYFTKCFKSAYGVSPSEYQKSYSGHTDIDTIRE